MSQESPAAILYDASGTPLAVQNGVAIPASTPGLLVMGSDGTNSRYFLIDSAGRPIIAGAGVAGTPAGGVVSVQGVVGGTAIPVSGSISSAAVGANGAAAPTSSDQIGGSDGTNLQASRIHDLDTGGGTEWNLGFSLRLPGAGGSTAGGTSANPVRVDPTGTTTQPISAATLPLPTGAATEATLATRVADTTITARLNTLGQKTSANSAPVVLASDQSAIPVTTSPSTTGTTSNVAQNVASTTILASNVNRKGATIVNDVTTKILLIKMGVTASATDYSARLMPGDYYEVPFNYTGRIDGLWTGAGSGAARVTEFT